jgi:outer membrane protein
MSLTRRLTTRSLVLSLLLASMGNALADTTTDQAKQFIEQGNAQAAYALLSPLESERAGDETYDLLLGIAANETGRATNAVMALERVLAINPKNVRARAEIASAYFALGEVKTAKDEFEIAKQQGIPPEVSKTIDNFLSAVSRIEENASTTVRGYVEASIGWDSNVNGGSNDSSIAIPAIGGLVLTLDDAGTKQEDTYLGLAGGVNLRKPLDPRLALTAGFSGSQRVNESWDKFNNGNWDANVGLTLTEDKDIYSINLQAGTFSLENDHYRDYIGFSAQRQHNIDKRNQITGFVQFAHQEYPVDNQYFMGKPRDSERWTVGLGGAHALRDFKTFFYGSVYVGIDDTKKQLTAQLDQRFHGVRGGAQHMVRDDLAFFANANYEYREHLDEDSFFERSRHDQTYSLGFGAIYTVQKSWKITPQYQYIDNRSNIRLNAYDRNIFSVTVRKDF